MRSIVRGVVALFAAFLMMDVAKAAPTIVSPADYARVMTLTDTMKNLISPLNSDVSIFSKANTTERSNYQTEYFYNNSLPVGLSWSGTTGNCTVKVWRTNGGSESAPFFSEMVSGTSTECYNLEVGCNYTWKVTDSQGNSAVGHFFTEDRAPRIIRGRRSNFTYSSGADCSNGRDIGGWATTNGKRVKQGMIYRSGQLEYCSFKNGSDTYQKMDILYDLLGIRVDVDLRTINNVNSFASWKAEWNNNQPFANPCVSSGIGPNVERFTIEWATLGKGPSDGNPYVYDGKYGCQFPSYSALYNSMSIDYKVGDTKKSYTQTASQNKIAVWAAFNRIYQAVVVDKEPVLFHCSHGKDRTGSLAAVIHGLLGVSEADIKRDFATAWFCNPDYTFTQTSMNTMLTGLKNLDTASTKTLAGGCEKYLISCATSAGDTAGSTKVTEFKTAMLEDVETPEGNVVTPEPEEDTFVYTHYYWRSPSDGGSISSQYNTGPWFTSLNDNSLMTPETQPILYSGTKWDSVRGSYSHCYNFITTSTKKYARTSNAGNPIMVGKLVFDAANGGGIKAGATNFKPFFTSEGHTVSDRTIIEHRGGLVEFDNVDIYLTQWGKDKYTSGRVSAYDGIASVDIWANATMRVKDFISVSPEKTYLKFLSGNSNNARLESLEHDDASYPYNSFGWFTGGAAGTKQYIKVQGAYPLKFSASGKTSGVVGALGLEFEFGANNGTGTAAMLQVAGALNINAGSTITVDAGGNGAGTYKLVSAGTLNDYANLDLRSNYTVTNCKDGYYGTIVKSGNNINLTIQEGTPPIEDEDEGLIDTEKEGDWGYRLKIGNEIVLVFTNHTKSVNWQVPSKLENVQFLVVGGGGGGGADTHASNTHGGAGGGGGGVVTGLVNFAENSVITVSVGAGGNGGVTATQGGSNSKYGAAYSGNASYVIVDGSEYFWTAGGGGDNGANESSNAPKTIGNVGNSGGSSAGSRPGQTERGAVVPSRVASVSNVKYADTSFGRQGGAGYYVTPADDSNTYYGYFSAAGGGGGATTEGETASTAQAAGKGGEGLASDITGTLRVYGSGGGGGAVAGGCGALGGTGAGCGNMTGVTAENYANYVNAVANQGGGGGGAARGIPGGKGGSGIVVLRYIDPDYSDPYVLTVPKAVTGLVYDGTVKTGVEGGTGYTLTGNTATDAGSYTATATLAEGYTWSDGSTATQTITWSIAKATNVWTTEPNITPASWIVGNTAGKLATGVAKFGTVTATMNGAAFTELPTAVGTYSIVCTVEATSNYTALSETITFEILEVPVINPTEYGKADSAESTYAWIGYTGPWMYTTNWTATASGTYGVPNNGTYATADFPATRENEFTCTLNQSVSVKYAKFDAPNMNLVLDNATLTITDRVDSGKYVAYKVGTNDNANVSVELSGANAGIVSSKKAGAASFGVEEESASGKIRCTVRFIVPATGWESTAPIRATGEDCSVYFWYDTKLEINATALGVPAENETKQVVLASSTNRLLNHGRVEITCADGAKGTVAVVGTKLVLTVEADETYQPEDPENPQLTAVDAPVAQTGLVYTGSELTGVVASTGYTLTGNTATDAGNYTAIATLAEGYKWSDGTTGNKEISWSIAKATNEWTTEPKISLESWTQGETAGVLTSGIAKFGTVTASMTELPTEVGSYTITYTVAETKNYTGLNATVQFEIKAPEVVEPEEPGDDPVSQIPTIPAEWGYVKTDLGDLHNEVAVVFTNHVDKAMSWTVPADIENVQFLVVGGGGGGGGAANATVTGSGGAGGGAGCVVTGIINKLDKDSVVTVNVGDGGKGGEYKASTTAGTGSADPGFDSSFGVDNVNYITAFGGAGDNGYNKDVSASGPGGSNPGARTKISSAVGVNAKAVWDSTLLATKMTNVVPLRNKGGHTNEDGSYNTYSSAGGGGATAEGHYPTTSNIGGWGGIGLLTDIAGDDVYYGSGGGGGSTKGQATKSYYPDGISRYDEVTNIWGSGRGVSNGNGEDALPNQGGGGGGAGKAGNGGKGGSGIVVFRYTLKSEVKVDAAEYIESKIANKVYTGSLLMSGLTEDAAYTISEEGGVNVGEYTVTVTLKSGFVWADGNTSSTSNFTWKITQHENKWATEPLLSVTSWAQGYASNVKFVAPVQTIGELNATITTNGVTEVFSGRLPTEPGEYTINYSVAGTDNYAGRTWSASFKIYRSEPIDGGYRIFGLGTKGNEEAMVFTQSGTWTLDKSLNNVQFLVVGGGGGGGADASATEGDPLQGGAGGGGGGVVTGLVNLVNGQTVAITVGTGGLGGIAGDNTPGKYGAAQSQATDSSFGIGNVTYVTAVAGGGDSGSISKSYNADLSGSNGGSGSGGRPNMAGGNADTENLDLTCIVCGDKLGNNGGSGCTTAWDGYGYAAAGGGGGAVHAGLPGYVDSTTGNYNGGNGGDGYLSDITGTELVYGSGGGGGTVKGGSVGGKGGTGAGDGVAGGNAASAVPNQGGGGGGGGRAGNGGNGGSGIVVFRYIVDTTPTVGGIEVKVDANGVITNITTACYDFIVAGDLSNYKFADYYTASVADDGKLKIALNPKVATPVISETASNNDDAIVVTDDAVALGVTNAKVGLYYSVEAYSDPICAGDPISATTPIPAACETLSLQIDKPNVDAAFFKIVVTDIPSAE